MRKIKMFVSALVIFIASFCMVPNVSATEIIDTNKSTREYTIDRYDIDVVVNENNTFDITEEITATFNVAKHGIFRSLPLHNELIRQDGTETKNRARVTNLKVSENYTTSYEDGYMKIKIGKSDEVHIGERKYKISYNYNIGKDPLEDKDEFYYNLVGTEWDTTISNVSFTIHMPKTFNKETFGVSTGSRGSTGSDDTLYRINGNDIYGQYLGTLNAYSGLTVRLELPEGYFVGAGFEVSQSAYVMYAVPVICFIIVAYLWSKYGKDKKTFIKPEYFPPEGKNSLDVGFLYKGSVSSNDVLSLLIYLANKGYLTIEETEESGLFSKKKGFKLKKLKDYNGSDSNEKTFFNGLFKGGKTEVTSKDLYDKFYKTTTSIMSNVNTTENKRKIFEKRGGIIALAVLMTIASMILISLPPFLDMGDYEMMIFSVVFPGIGFTAMIFGIIGLITSKGAAERAVYVFLLFWGTFFGGIPFLVMMLPELTYEPVYVIGYVIGLISVIGQIVFIRILPKRTEYGIQVYAEIQGFKDFLTSVEKDRIEQMVEQYPTYFYDILPYTYVLGISDKWIKKFEDINLKAPDWYEGSTAFNAAAFGSFMHSTMSTASSTMSSSASHSSGGGGGGGGFSGGGSGGGGGGSW